MPNSAFSAFSANYWAAIGQKKVRFCIPNTVFNVWLVKVLLYDNFIKTFSIWSKTIELSVSNIDEFITLNRLVIFSTSKAPYHISSRRLNLLAISGGYFLLSTKFGIINSSVARRLNIGGILLLGIF